MWHFNDEIYYTLKEAAKMTGIPYNTMKARFVRGLIKGALPRTPNCSEQIYHPNLVPWSYIKAEKERIDVGERLKASISATISNISDYQSLPHAVKIRKVRETLHADKQVIANLVGVSAMLMDILEEGGTTHPKLAKKVGKIYQMTNLEIELMMPPNYRKKHGKGYDPDKYKSPVDIYGMGSYYFGRWRFGDEDEGYEEIRPEIFEEGTDEEAYK